MPTTTRNRRVPPRPGADAAAAPTVPPPTFSPPPEQQEEEFPGPPAGRDMPLIEERTTGPTLPSRDDGSWTPYGDVGSRDTIRTRTDISSDLTTGPSGASKAETARNAGVLLTGVLTVVVGAAAVVLARAGRQLRRPTTAQTRDVARPLARVLVRHIPADLITADLADLGDAAAAVSAYVTEGPVAPRVVPIEHIGMEHADDPSPTTPAAPTVGDVWHAATHLQEYPSALGTPGPAPEVSYQQ